MYLELNNILFKNIVCDNTEMTKFEEQCLVRYLVAEYGVNIESYFVTDNNPQNLAKTRCQKRPKTYANLNHKAMPNFL